MKKLDSSSIESMSPFVVDLFLLEFNLSTKGSLERQKNRLINYLDCEANQQKFKNVCFEVNFEKIFSKNPPSVKHVVTLVKRKNSSGTFPHIQNIYNETIVDLGKENKYDLLDQIVLTNPFYKSPYPKVNPELEKSSEYMGLLNISPPSYSNENNLKALRKSVSPIDLGLKRLILLPEDCPAKIFCKIIPHDLQLPTKRPFIDYCLIKNHLYEWRVHPSGRVEVFRLLKLPNEFERFPRGREESKSATALQEASNNYKCKGNRKLSLVVSKEKAQNESTTSSTSIEKPFKLEEIKDAWLFQTVGLVKRKPSETTKDCDPETKEISAFKKINELKPAFTKQSNFQSEWDDDIEELSSTEELSSDNSDGGENDSDLSDYEAFCEDFEEISESEISETEETLEAVSNNETITMGVNSKILYPLKRVLMTKNENEIEEAKTGQKNLGSKQHNNTNAMEVDAHADGAATKRKLLPDSDDLASGKKNKTEN